MSSAAKNLIFWGVMAGSALLIWDKKALQGFLSSIQRASKIGSKRLKDSGP